MRLKAGDRVTVNFGGSFVVGVITYLLANQVTFYLRGEDGGDYFIKDYQFIYREGKKDED